MMWTSILLVTITGIILYCYFTKTYNFWENKNIAGPKPIMLFGNLKESILRRKHIGAIYKEIYDKYPNEKVVGIYRMTSPTLLIRDLDIIKQILIKDFEVFPDRGMEFSKKGLGDNLFHCDSNTWQGLRGHLSPLFSTGKLKSMFPLMNFNADQLVNMIQEATLVKQEQEIFQYFRKYAMATIMSTLFGINVDLFKENHEEMEKVGKSIFRSTYANEMDMLFPNILRKWDISLFANHVKKFSYDLIDVVSHRKKDLNTLQNVIDVLLNLKSKQEKNGERRLSINKKANKAVTVTEHLIAGQVFVFFGPGFGNNALSMPYALFRLAKDQDIQNKLVKEIDNVLKKFDGKLTNSALKEMTTLDNVFSEVLRMNTLSHALLRLSMKRYSIPGTDITIDKGTPIMISPYAIHRDEKLYPDPDKFDPERFSAENSANRHSCAYIPFGAGPRSCIGRQFAKMQFSVGIVKVLRKFRVEPSEKTKIIEDYDPMHTFLATKGGIHVKFIPRNL